MNRASRPCHLARQGRGGFSSLRYTSIVEELRGRCREESIFNSQRPISHRRSLGGAPIFPLSRDSIPKRRAEVLSLRIAMNSFFLLIGSYFIGTHILKFFGISLPVVQVAEASSLSRPAGRCSNNAMTTTTRMPSATCSQKIPAPCLLSADSAADRGSGLHFHRHHPGRECPIPRGVSRSGRPGRSYWVGILAASIFLCYAFADRLARALGATGMTVIVQLTSFLLVCIGVQIFWNGASVLLASALSRGG